jgi:hypothetical protein
MRPEGAQVSAELRSDTASAAKNLVHLLTAGNMEAAGGHVFFQLCDTWRGLKLVAAVVNSTDPSLGSLIANLKGQAEKLYAHPQWIHLLACLASHWTLSTAVPHLGTQNPPSSYWNYLDQVPATLLFELIAQPINATCADFVRLIETGAAQRSGSPGQADHSRDSKQAILLYLFSRIGYVYRKSKSPMERTPLAMILVPAIRTLFTDTDSAYYFHQRYGFDNQSVSGEPTNLTEILSVGSELYREIADLKALERNARLKRTELLDLLRPQETIAPELGPLVDKLLHGDQFPTSHKPTKVAQVTYLVRSGETHGGTPTFYDEFETYKVRYLTRSGNQWQEEDKNTISNFHALVRASYKSGWPLPLLQGLFEENDQRLNTGPFSEIVCIAEGEFLFCLLLAGFTKVPREQRQDWVEYSQTPVILADDELLPPGCNLPKEEKQSQTLKLTIGTCLEGFLQEWKIVDASGNLLPRFWSLYNYLERCRFGQEKLKDGLRSVLNDLYDRIRSANDHSSILSGLKSVLKSWDPPTDLEALKQQFRLPSILIEGVLRMGDRSPRTLFFYPTLRAPMMGVTSLPQAFLAGTLIGIESSKWPYVSLRVNEHIALVENAISPMLARVASQRMREVLVGERIRTKLAAFGRWADETLKGIAQKERERTDKLRQILGDIGLGAASTLVSGNLFDLVQQALLEKLDALDLALQESVVRIIEGSRSIGSPDSLDPMLNSLAHAARERLFRQRKKEIEDGFVLLGPILDAVNSWEKSKDNHSLLSKEIGIAQTGSGTGGSTMTMARFFEPWLFHVDHDTPESQVKDIISELRGRLETIDLGFVFTKFVYDPEFMSIGHASAVNWNDCKPEVRQQIASNLLNKWKHNPCQLKPASVLFVKHLEYLNKIASDGVMSEDFVVCLRKIIRINLPDFCNFLFKQYKGTLTSVVTYEDRVVKSSDALYSVLEAWTNWVCCLPPFYGLDANADTFDASRLDTLSNLLSATIDTILREAVTRGEAKSAQLEPRLMDRQWVIRIRLEQNAERTDGFINKLKETNFTKQQGSKGLKAMLRHIQGWIGCSIYLRDSTGVEWQRDLHADETLKTNDCSRILDDKWRVAYELRISVMRSTS